MHRCLFALAFAAACGASTSSQAPKAGAGTGSGSGSGSNMICHEVSDTGSLMKHTECTPADDDDQQREDAQRTLKRMPTGTPKAGH